VFDYFYNSVFGDSPQTKSPQQSIIILKCNLLI